MIANKLDSIEKAKKLLEIREQQLLGAAITSGNPSDILKAHQHLGDIVAKQDTGRKTYLFDPQSFSQSFGFKDKATSLSYSMLKSMSKASVINAIIKTRINQIASFAEPQRDKYSVGYQIRKKKKLNDKEEDLTDSEK